MLGYNDNTMPGKHSDNCPVPVPTHHPHMKRILENINIADTVITLCNTISLKKTLPYNLKNRKAQVRHCILDIPRWIRCLLLECL